MKFFTLVLCFLNLSFVESSNNGGFLYANSDDDEDLYNEINYILQHHSTKQWRQQPHSSLLQSVQIFRTGAPHPVEVKSWEINYPNLGQVSGIAVDQQNNLVVFHRGSHVFDDTSFNITHHYQKIHDGPIQNATILIFNSTTGDVIKSLGANRFYLPHGLTIDNDGNIWVTDVGLHQVIKLSSKFDEPLLVLGEAFVPGSDTMHFCKPTDVAIASNGDIFISDGYCNSRVQKYSAEGMLIAEWGHSGGRSIFAIPHSIALIEDQDMLCVADRDNRRIQCFSAGLSPATTAGKFIYQVSTNQIGRVYGITYGGVYGDGLLHGVAIGNDATGFTVDLDSGEIIDNWRPEQGFDNPHDLGISPDGRNIYVGEISPNRVIKFTLQ